MTSLADELLNDFEDDAGSEVEPGLGAENDAKPQYDDKTATNGEAHDAEQDETMDNADGAEKTEDQEQTAKDEIEKMQFADVGDVRSVARLMKTLEPVLNKIAHHQSLPPEQRTTSIGHIEDNPEYHLLTESNTLATSIDNEVILVHKFIRDHYSARYPELESLVTNPLDYAKTVAILKNGPLDNVKALAGSTDNLVGAPLQAVLDGPSLMVVTVEATTTRGRPLADAELKVVLEACKMQMDLDRAKAVLTDYVQSRMNIFAPNLTVLIGSLTAAQLINFAGGLTGLAKTPSCNIPPLGSKKQSGTGFATNIGVRHQGFLYRSPIIQNIPNDLKKQAMRIVSAKLVLAARVDCVHQSPDGSVGQDLKQSCLDRLDKLTEPPPNKGPKALPVPDDKPARKRGGRRARKAKEAVAMTEIRRAQNRVAFGKEEAEAGLGTGESTAGLGMLGQADTGRVRALQVDQRTKAKLSKSNKGWGAVTPLTGTTTSLRAGPQSGTAALLQAKGLRAGPSALGSGAGTASSIAFTPVQGLELADPKAMEEMKRKRKAEEDRWFRGGTFTQLGTNSQPPTKKPNTSMGPPPIPKN